MSITDTEYQEVVSERNAARMQVRRYATALGLASKREARLRAICERVLVRGDMSEELLEEIQGALDYRPMPE